MLIRTVPLAALILSCGLAVAGRAQDATVPFVVPAPDSMAASRMIDAPVFDAGERRIGEIVDLLFGEGMRVSAVVVGIGAGAGAADRYVAVDPAALRLSPGPDGRWRASLVASPEALRAAPSMPYRSGWTE